MSETKNEIHKELELERLILFSDAVFAIAITLIIIEIKFPDIEKGDSVSKIWQAFKPVLIQFLAFSVSFFLIGQSWMQHLQLFRYLTKYNRGLVKRNLVFLFFIVCFPFSASGITEHIRPGFLLPINIYTFNIAAVSVCQYAITNYIFRVKTNLCIEGYEQEKNYLLLNAKWMALLLSFVFISYVLVVLFLPLNPFSVTLPSCILALPALVIIIRLKKLKPASMNEM